MFVPNIRETNGDETRTCDIISRLLDDRVIVLCGEIDDNMSTIICSEMLFLDARDSEKEMYLYINSPGGSVSAGLAIYDTMQFISAPVTTFCFGLAASMGAFLLASGTTGHRFALPHAEIMVHQPYSGIQGQTTEIEIYARRAMFYKDMLNELMARHSGLSSEKIVALTDRDTFLTPQQAMELGFIDGIIASKADIRNLAA